jgi:hypothetical protein
MNPIFGTAGLAEIPIADQRQFAWAMFAASTMLFLVYCLCAFGPWAYTCRHSLRKGQLSLRSLLALGLLTPPALVLLLIPALFLFLLVL